MRKTVPDDPLEAVTTSQTRRELVANPGVVAHYGEIVAKVNGTLAQFETMKRFRVVADEWTLETGELTPSMKLKRRVIIEKYKDQIAAFYNGDVH